jgi:hypothetical protein
MNLRQRIPVISNVIFVSNFRLFRVVQPGVKKFSAFLLGQITCVWAASRAHQRGARDRHGRGAWDAVDAEALLTNGAEADGEVVWS